MFQKIFHSPEMPELKGVLISETMTENVNYSGRTFSTSGILVSPSFLLSHGTLISPLLMRANSSDVVKNFLLHVNENSGLFLVPKEISKTLQFHVQYNENSRGSVGNKKSKISEDSARIVALWKCPLLQKTFHELLYSWTFEKLGKFDKSLLPIFVILQIGDSKIDISVKDVTKTLSTFYQVNFTVKKFSDPKRGNVVEIDSTPFGNVVFLNSISRGVISNIVGERDCVILSDAYAVPGCEGAPLFVLCKKGSRNIFGLVIASLSWCRGEWVDYTFAANLKSCLENLLELKNYTHKENIMNNTVTLSNFKPLELLAEKLDKSVVVVKCGSGWGTGIIIDVSTGTIVTCSHVVREAGTGFAKVLLCQSTDVDANAWAKIVYRTADDQPYDIAVLKLQESPEVKEYKKKLQALTLSSETPKIGDAVMVAGFPFFGGSSASLSLGNISRIEQGMLQSTCCVQSGASGGPVVSCSTGEVIALVVSNAVNATDSSLYPRFNMAVPSLVIKDPIEKYVKTGEVKFLESLLSQDPEAQQTWNFYLAPKSKL